MYCCIPKQFKELEAKYNWLFSTLIIFSYMVASPNVFAQARSVDQPIGTVKVFLDDTATLQCDLHNLHEHDHIVWYHKGRYLSDDEVLTTQVPPQMRGRVSVECNRNRESCALMIHTSSYDDSGTYKCGFGFINQEDQVVIRLVATGHLVVARKPTTTAPPTTTTSKTTTTTTTSTTSSPVTTVLPLSMTSSAPTRTRNPANSSPFFQSLISTSSRSYNGNAYKTRLTQSAVDNRLLISLTASPKKQGNLLIYVLVAIAITMIVFAIFATTFIINHWRKRYLDDSLQDPEYCNLTREVDTATVVNESLKKSRGDKPESLPNTPAFTNEVINKETFEIADSHTCYANVATSGALNGRRGRFTSKKSIKYAELDLPSVSLPVLPLSEEATSYADIKQFQ